MRPPGRSSPTSLKGRAPRSCSKLEGAVSPRAPGPARPRPGRPRGTLAERAGDAPPGGACDARSGAAASVSSRSRSRLASRPNSAPHHLDGLFAGSGQARSPSVTSVPEWLAGARGMTQSLTVDQTNKLMTPVSLQCPLGSRASSDPPARMVSDSVPRSSSPPPAPPGRRGNAMGRTMGHELPGLAVKCRAGGGAAGPLQLRRRPQPSTGHAGAPLGLAPDRPQRRPSTVSIGVITCIERPARHRS